MSGESGKPARLDGDNVSRYLFSGATWADIERCYAGEDCHDPITVPTMRSWV
jgi:hypothetical protein